MHWLVHTVSWWCATSYVSGRRDEQLWAVVSRSSFHGSTFHLGTARAQRMYQPLSFSHLGFSSFHYILCVISLQSLEWSSVLWHCWLGVRKSIRPVNIDWWGVGVVICLEQGADCLHMGPADDTAISKLLPHLNPDWFYLSGASLPGLSWKRSC